MNAKNRVIDALRQVPDVHEVRVIKGRVSLILDHPWFGSLALNLTLINSCDVDTMATDATSLWFNPDFVDTLSDAELIGVLAHEVLHCAMGHVFRRGSRDPEQWNISCDYVANLILIKSGFTLPKCALLDPQYEGLSAEQVYSIRQQAGNPQPANGQKVIGEMVDPQAQGTQPGPAAGQGQQPGQQAQPGPAQGNTESDWQIYTEQASAVAKLAGVLPGDAAKAAKLAQTRAEDWVALTKEFVQHLQPRDISWTRPNKRFIAQGLYLPGVYKENLGHCKVIIDTSDSIYRAVGEFATQVQAIMSDAKPESIEVIYCDARVKNAQTFTADDFAIDKLQAKGGGGTLFNPAFDYIAKQDEEPTFAIYFTDLDNGGEKVRDPGYPVLWVTAKNVTRKQPFGQLAVIDVDM